MTFAEALLASRDEGKRIRHPGMARGWTVGYFSRAANWFCINPHTQSEYLYVATEPEKQRTDWKVVP